MEVEESLLLYEENEATKHYQLGQYQHPRSFLFFSTISTFFRIVFFFFVYIQYHLKKKKRN